MTAVLSPLREGRITGSRAPKILGKSTLGTRATVLREMVRDHFGAPDEFIVTPPVQWGNDHEADAVHAYAEYRHVEVHDTGRGQIFIPHPLIEFLGVTPDGTIREDGGRIIGGVEAKCPYWTSYTHISQRPDYEIQVRLSQACAEAEWWDFAAWVPGNIYVSRVEYDPWWLDEQMPMFTEFIEEYRATIADPELAAAHLAPLVDERTDVDWATTAAEYLEALAVQQAAEENTERARKALIELAGDKSAKGGGVSVNRTTRKGSVDYAKVAKEYAPDADLDKYRKAPTVVWTVRQAGEKA